MTIFDDYVESVLRDNKQFSNQRITVEKELFHQEILRLISATDLMKDLVFIGGTCLRLCYESERLSEDLDFSTERVIAQEEAENLSETIRCGLSEKFGLPVYVRKPQKETDTETWKISIVTNPGHSNIPAQQIHLDICHYPSYLKELRLVRNAYCKESSYPPLFIMAERREEILIDKLIAFTYRRRIKNRDLWDIFSLYCRNTKLDTDVLERKLKDRNHSKEEFIASYNERAKQIESAFPPDFNAELSRFLSSGTFEGSILSTKDGPAVFSTILSDYRPEGAST